MRLGELEGKVRHPVVVRGTFVLRRFVLCFCLDFSRAEFADEVLSVNGSVAAAPVCDRAVLVSVPPWQPGGVPGLFMTVLLVRRAAVVVHPQLACGHHQSAEQIHSTEEFSHILVIFKWLRRPLPHAQVFIRPPRLLALVEFSRNHLL